MQTATVARTANAFRLLGVAIAVGAFIIGAGAAAGWIVGTLHDHTCGAECADQTARWPR